MERGKLPPLVARVGREAFALLNYLWLGRDEFFL
jgi:hypothetical protein